ncbi:hypothetical protein CJ179_23615 [Rhodococcus sp. ACS1]|jgi:hypothetical protein|uniref:Uncharacterized protein n=1 Tax=Rhodococcus koreensis TaxID=99653 RepID=A0A1H4TM66_9NOCA|nr:MULTISPECIES: hypothetical protein [Rhodococcus]PBC46117.1 hypothetical protein CJ179_23615 [Rhodococcus sp. ACS1]SEC57593.1 hypothetical protein SAMN04490239_4601 [Rhodococcus koreensis]
MNAICAEPTSAEAGAFACALGGFADLRLGAALVLIGILAFIASGVAIVLPPAPARTPIAE